jgi:hypothetical protein
LCGVLLENACVKEANTQQWKMITEKIVGIVGAGFKTFRVSIEK